MAKLKPFKNAIAQIKSSIRKNKTRKANKVRNVPSKEEEGKAQQVVLHQEQEESRSTDEESPLLPLETSNVKGGGGGGGGDDDEGNSDKSMAEPPMLVEIRQQYPVQLSLLVSVTWCASILFGLFAAVHYVYPAIVKNRWECWNTTDPGLYRFGCVLPNHLMVTHMIGGIYMMFAGPVQLIRSIRKRYIQLHRWVGRFYIVAALVASGFALSFCITYSNGRDDPNENVANVILGTSVFVSAIQSYRYVKEGDINQHKIWSYRLYACVLGAVLYRLYQTVNGGLVIFTPLTLKKRVNDVFLYIMVLPNLVVVELIWRKKFHPKEHLTLLTSCAIFIGTAASLIFSLFWFPAMIGSRFTGASSFVRDEGDYSHARLCDTISAVKAIGILIVLMGSALIYLNKRLVGST